MSLDTSLELREDLYSVKFLYTLKREFLFKGNPSKSNWYVDYETHAKSLTGKWRFMILSQLILVWFLCLETW